MVRRILLIEDQPDIRGLLRSALGTLRAPDIETFEAASGEQAIHEFARRPIDLLVLKSRLPDIPAIELMHGLRAGRPNLRFIVITEASDRGKRDEMVNAGAAAVFEKPVPLGDFLDAVERGLGLTPTIFPLEEASGAQARQPRISDLLANLRQDVKAEGVSLISGLAAIFSAGLKVARSHRQSALRQYAVFQGDSEDLILMPVDQRYALLLAGHDLAPGEGRSRSLDAMRAVCAQLQESLSEAEATDEEVPPAQPVTAVANSRPVKMDDLLPDASGHAVRSEDLDSFWDKASAQSTEAPSDADALSYEEARKLGLTPKPPQE